MLKAIAKTTADACHAVGETTAAAAWWDGLDCEGGAGPAPAPAPVLHQYSIPHAARPTDRQRPSSSRKPVVRHHVSASHHSTLSARMYKDCSNDPTPDCAKRNALRRHASIDDISLCLQRLWLLCTPKIDSSLVFSPFGLDRKRIKCFVRGPFGKNFTS